MAAAFGAEAARLKQEVYAREQEAIDILVSSIVRVAAAYACADAVESRQVATLCQASRMQATRGDGEADAHQASRLQATRDDGEADAHQASRMQATRDDGEADAHQASRMQATRGDGEADAHQASRLQATSGDGEADAHKTEPAVAALGGPSPMGFQYSARIPVPAERADGGAWVFTVQIERPGQPAHTVVKRYSDFKHAHAQLAAHSSGTRVPQLPPRHMFRSQDKSFAEERRADLDRYEKP